MAKGPPYMRELRTCSKAEQHQFYELVARFGSAAGRVVTDEVKLYVVQCIKQGIPPQWQRVRAILAENGK